MKATLYVCRPVKNAEMLIAWAKKQGFETTLPGEDMHVTLAFSKKPLVWPPRLKSQDDLIVRAPGNPPREVMPLGDKGAVVLKFDSPALYDRWRFFVDAGAQWAYATFQPHITITYDGKGVDLSKVEPYAGAIILGREKFAEVDSDWDKKVDEEEAA